MVAPLAPLARLVLWIWLVPLPWPAGILGHQCSYEIPREDQIIRQVYLEPTNRVRKRAAFSNLRIFLYFDLSIDKLPRASSDFVKTNLLPDAQAFWQKALLVKPSGSPIRLYRKCVDSQYYVRPFQKHQHCVRTCKSATACGEVLVPDAHLYQCRYCHNITSSSCGRSGPPDGRGVPYADFLLYVSAVDSDRCRGKDTVAYAAHCQQEKALDRPIAGHVNLCPKAISTHQRDQEILFSTVKHEILHALGFSAGLYAFYRDEEGNPLTTRNDHGKPSLLNKAKGFYEWSEKVGRSVPRPDWWTLSGPVHHEVHMIVTKRVREVAREYFNCSLLEGAELENQGKDGTALTHWEKRVFENEAMTGTHTQNPVYSKLTLALMEDTGWYRANYDVVQPLQWGRGLGCDFAMGSCGGWVNERLARNESPAPFCTQVKATEPWHSAKTTCTNARDSVALCNLVRYTQDLPNRFQNFAKLDNVPHSDLARFGGSVELADFCAYNQEFEWKSERKPLLNNSSHVAVKRDSRCELVENTPADSSNAALETYGEFSRCFHQNKDWILSKCGYRRKFSHYGAGCYEFACKDGLLWLDLLNGTAQYPCYHAGQPILVRRVFNGWLHEGTIVCPGCSELCEDCLPERKPKYPVVDPRLEVPCFASAVLPCLAIIANIMLLGYSCVFYESK